MTRKVSLGSFELDHKGIRLTPQILVSLQTKKCADIVSFCHPMRALQHSVFENTIHVIDGTVEMEFFLSESAFFGLSPEFLPTPTPTAPTTSISESRSKIDPFSVELKSVLEALSLAPTHLILACSPAVNRAALRGNMPNAAQSRAFRNAASGRRGTTPMLPGLGGPASLLIPKIPKYLPTGTVARITARVTELPPSEAILEDIEVTNALGQEQPTLPRTMTLRRKIHGPMAAKSQLLLEAQDHGHRLALQVVVLDSWIDGTPQKLDLISVQQLNDSHEDLS